MPHEPVDDVYVSTDRKLVTEGRRKLASSLPKTPLRKVLGEHTASTLRSRAAQGPRVRTRRQAVATALRSARRLNRGR